MRPASDPASSNRRRAAAWLAGLALAAASPIAAQVPHSSPSEGTHAEEAKAEAVMPAGLRAFIDPETGELTSTPTRQQVEDLTLLIEQQTLAGAEAALSRSSFGLEPFELTGGGRGVHLKGRFQSALVVRLTDLGELELVCRDDAAETQHEHPAATAPAEWAEK